MKKILAILLAVAMAFSFAACGTEKEKVLTEKKVLEIIEDNPDKIDNSAFDGYEVSEGGSVYKTYTYTIGKNASVIVTTDKNTGETLQSYLFIGNNYINLKDGKEAVEKFIEENPIEELDETATAAINKTTTAKDK